MASILTGPGLFLKQLFLRQRRGDEVTAKTPGSEGESRHLLRQLFETRARQMFLW